MRIIGQTHITNELGFILPELYETKRGENFLLRGPSGCGKTHLGLSICKYLSGHNYQIALGDKINFNENTWVHFFDEIHLCKEPEILYPYMDRKDYTIILATNEFSELPEALMNRCINFIFSDYTNEELIEIIEEKTYFRFSEDGYLFIIDSCARNPRIILKMIKRLILYEKINGKINSLDELKFVFERYFSIVDGLDVLARNYLQTLEKVGGRASLDTLSSLMHTDKVSIKYLIEPILLYKEKIQITSRGRILT